MNIVCVQCGVAVASDLPVLADQTVIVCTACHTGLRITLLPCAVPVATPPPPPPGAESRTSTGRILVAVEGEATREFIRELLTPAGFQVVEAATGKEALRRIQEEPPRVAVIDVGLTDMLGFQVCEAIRADTRWADVKILLMAAIYNKDRYKRQPGHLYGADAFIERHRLEDELLGKVRMMCEGAPVRGDQGPAPVAPPAPQAQAPTPSVAPSATPVTPPAARAAEAIPPEPIATPRPTPTPGPIAKPPTPQPAVAGGTSSPSQEAASRLARIIISDIALYNPKKVDEGVLQGTFFDVLRQEIEEGRRLYEERRPPELASAPDYFQQTLEQFIQTRRRLLQRSDPAAA